MGEFVTHEFEPEYNSESNVLILGTIPSPKSRENGYYYSHPQNRFWKVMAALFGEPVPSSVVEKKEFVMRHHIALWDVLQSCEIHGAADSSIRNETPNDLNLILNTADIRAIFTTGKKADALYRKYCLPLTGREAICLPSTSPANCAVKMDQLIEAYRVILTYLSE
jgi:TDG/mug DNA glycosylase family protein